MSEYLMTFARAYALASIVRALCDVAGVSLGWTLAAMVVAVVAVDIVWVRVSGAPGPKRRGER